jgi:hypothetical protein
MTFVDRIARLGWIATGVAALVAASACATSQGSNVPVSTTTTTGASSAATPEGVELYIARQNAGRSCGADLRANVDFVARTADMLPGEISDVERWARCLNQPELLHATVVLVGGVAASESQELFIQRAQRIRDALIARGVDPQRVIIGATNASREGGPYAALTGVRVEVTSSQTVRSFVPADTGVRRAFR